MAKSTMRDVAQLADVSVATVSRYINKSGYVSEESGKKIEQAINNLDYSPNEVARSLYQNKSKFIGLLLPDINNPFFTMVAKGVGDELNHSDYSLILANLDDDLDREEEYLKVFHNNVAGLISLAYSNQRFLTMCF